MSKNPTHHKMVSPKATHTRPATCQEVACKDFERGWTTTLPINSEQVSYIRFELTGYHFSERSETYLMPVLRDGRHDEWEGHHVVVFTFPEGQPCFRQGHRKSLERTPFFFKGNSMGLIRQEPLEWLDNLGNKLVKGTW